MDIKFYFFIFITSCEAVWHKFNDNYYLFKVAVSDKTTWQDAASSCAGEHTGATLAVIHSVEENNFIFDTARETNGFGVSSVWIGMYREQTTGNPLVWQDKSAIDYTRWDTNEPDGQNGNARCVQMHITTVRNQNWEDSDCSLSLAYVCQYAQVEEEDPCLSHVHTTVHEDYTRSTKYKLPAGESPRCDLFIEERWYRFTGRAGGEMPLQPPDTTSCGTAYPMWHLAGTLDGSGIVESVACIRTPYDLCAATTPIKYKRCTDFTVYYLTRPNSCVAYCIGSEVPCPADETSSNGYTPGCTAGYFPAISEPTISYEVVPRRQHSFQLFMLCELQEYEQHVLYNVTWCTDDQQIQTLDALEGDEFPVRLHESDLQLSSNLRCEVTPRYRNSTLPGITQSTSYYVGIEVLKESQVLVENGGPITVQLRPTLPILCHLGIQCWLRVDIYTGNEENIDTQQPAVCPHSAEIPHQLGVAFSSEEEYCGIRLEGSNDATLPQTYNVTVVASEDGLYDGTQRVKLSFKAKYHSQHTVWSDYAFETQFIVQDKDAVIEGKYCSVTDDPHMQTFDGRSYEHHMEGEFILYQHDTLPIQVFGYFSKCRYYQHFPVPPTCICGAAVRAGGDLYLYDHCRTNKALRSRLYHCEDEGLVVEEMNARDSYRVTVSTGTQIILRRNSITIYPSLLDYNHVAGLCGTLNNDKDDDFLLQDGSIYDGNEAGKSWLYPLPFSSSWRVLQQQSLYTGPAQAPAEPADVIYCTCNGTGVASCGHMGTVNQPCAPVQTQAIDDPQLLLPRCIGDLEENLDVNQYSYHGDDVEDPVVMFEYDPSYVAEPPEWSDGWTEVSARDFCTTFITSNSAVQKCSAENVGHVQEAIQSCIVDIKITSNTSYSLVHLDSVIRHCEHEISRNMSYYHYTNSSDVIQKPDFLLQDICASACSNRGKCVNGVCQCYSGFTGNDCSFEEEKIPMLYDIPNHGLCDISERPCTVTPVYGDYFIQSERLVCRITPTLITPQNNEVSFEAWLLQPQYVYSEKIFCPLSAPQQKDYYSSASYIAVKYTISISNDAVHFSENATLLTYDSQCVECTAADSQCRIKDDTCHISGQCFSAGEGSSSQLCTVCDPARSQTTWTVYAVCLQDNGGSRTPVMALLWLPLYLVILKITTY